MSRPILPNSQASGLHGQQPPLQQQQQQQPAQQHSEPQFEQQLQIDTSSQYVSAAQDPPLPSASSANAPLNSPTEIIPASASSSKPTYAKRGKITIVACVPCRKRKTKCDGHRPSCTQCLSRNGPCSYDMTDDQRKLTFLRGEVESLEEKTGVLEGLLSTIQAASNEEAAEVFRRLRFGGDLHEVANDVNAGRLLSGVGGVAPGRSDGDERQRGNHHRRYQPRLDHYERLVRALALSDTAGSQDIVRRLKNSEEIPLILKNLSRVTSDTAQLVQRRTPTGMEGKFASQEHTFGMVKGAEMRATHASLGQETEFVVGDVRRPWTTVTQDEELIQHLLDVYFTWQHSFFQSFPENLFRSDMAAGRTKYCSPMLVNAICAAGCFLSERSNVDQLVEPFYEEAMKLYKDDSKPTISTTATLYLTSYVEGTRGRLSTLWMSSGASSLMAVDLNLHLKRHPKPANTSEEEQESMKEAKARTHAFWGCFHVDQLAAFTLGRLPNFNIHGVTVDVPHASTEEDQLPWHPLDSTGPNRPGARSSTFRSCADLSTIVNGTLLMFFAPTVPLSGGILVEEYQKYLDWKASLPSILQVTEDASPHILCLHMYYWAAVLLLFRPFLKAKILSRPDLVPRELARTAADKISEIWEQHRKLYNYSGIYMFQVHCLLTACTIHIISIPSPSPTNHFTRACSAFQDLSERNEWARSSIRILRNLSRRWNLILPKDAEAALYRDVQDHPESPELQPAISPPSFMQPTNPANAFSNEQQFLAQRQSHFPQLETSNIDPALASPSIPSVQNSNQIPSKRSASDMASHQASPARPAQGGIDSVSSLHQKRPRMIASTQAQVPGDPAAASSAALDQQALINSVGDSFQQQLQNPGNYLYAPLANQPPPFLVPVRQPGSQVASTAPMTEAAVQQVQQSQPQQQNQQPTTTLPSSTAGMQSSNGSSVKQEERHDQNGSSSAPQGPPPQAQATAQPPNQAQRARSGQPSGAQEQIQSAVRTGATEQINPNSVEGLSFSDDFRDPFMGFLEVD